MARRFRIRGSLRTGSPIPVVIVLVVALILLIVLHVVGVLKPVESLLLRIVRVPLSAAYSFGSGTLETFGSIGKIGSLPKENATLRNEVDRLNAEAVRVEELERENDILREQLGFVQESDAETIPALVIGRPPFSEFQLIVIDKGSRDGVTEDQAVILSSGLLVGRVFEVQDATSTVLLLTDVHSTVHAVIQGSRANGIVTGDRGIGLVLDSIPRSAEVESEDRVLTTGLSGVFPKGLLLGTIDDVSEPGSDLFREARLNPAADFNVLEFVFLIRDE